MCRLCLYIGRDDILLATITSKPKNSLLHQSLHDSPYLPMLGDVGNVDVKDLYQRNAPLNGDGFGVAVYLWQKSEDVRRASKKSCSNLTCDEEKWPLVFCSISPSWNSRNLTRLANRLYSTCILAHVRAAPPGSLVAEANCHPFSFGRLSFAHNGGIFDATRVRLQILSIVINSTAHLVEGTTDSEAMFALFLHFLYGFHRREGSCGEAEPVLDEFRVFCVFELKIALLAVIETVLELCSKSCQAANPHHGRACSLNLVVTNGSEAVCTRLRNSTISEPPSLYVAVGRNIKYDEDSRLFAMDHHDVFNTSNPDASHNSIFVSSEPLTEQPDQWKLVPRNTLITINSDLLIDYHPIQIPQFME